MKIPRRNKFPIDENNRVLRDAFILLLMQDAQRQIKEGRPGPENLDFKQLCNLFEKGVLSFRIVPGNPSYPEMLLSP